MNRAMPSGFDYFRGPAKDMSGWVDRLVECWFCGSQGGAFELDFAICPALPQQERSGKFGCAECLRLGRFEFWHDTDIGVLDENGLTHVYKHNRSPPADFPPRALVELLRTPQIATWQQELWLTHCLDFMAYLGTWEPKDFVAHAPTGGGRALFCAMTPAELQFLWDASREADAPSPAAWHATYDVFQCRKCGLLAGHWDCD